MAATMAVSATVCVNAQTTQPIQAHIQLKSPGNAAKDYPLTLKGDQWQSTQSIPVSITQRINASGNDKQISITLSASEDVYFHFSADYVTNASHSTAQFLLPGFWYRQNLRSPKESPSFHTSDSWTFREDRFSTPIVAVYDEASSTTTAIMRTDAHPTDALTTHREGQVILSGKTSVGYLGFKNIGGKSALSFGFPYEETPKTYNRKLTLSPSIEAFQQLEKGESITLTWALHTQSDANFGECVQHVWEYSYDHNKPQPVNTPYTDARMKEVLSNFFTESFVDKHATNYYAGVELQTATCAHTDVCEVGFVGRVLLNAFNALEYAEQNNNATMAKNAQSVFDSFLKNGMLNEGFFMEARQWERGWKEERLSIRRQSEGVYAVLLYLDYEKRHGRSHKDWEEKIKNILTQILSLQNEDGSLPRKFKADKSIADLQCGYIDVLFIHWPFPNYHAPHCDGDSRNPDSKPFSVAEFLDTYRQIEELVRKGKVRAIGISNLTIPKLEQVYDKLEIKPVMCESEIHPCFQQVELVEYLKAHGIQPVGFMPLGSPRRPERDIVEGDVEDMKEPELVEIAKAHNCHSATICLKWAWQRGLLPIPFSVHNFESNIDCTLTEPLSDEEMAKIATMEKNNRLVKGQVFLWPGATDWHDLWDEDGVIVDCPDAV